MSLHIVTLHAIIHTLPSSAPGPRMPLPSQVCPFSSCPWSVLFLVLLAGWKAPLSACHQIPRAATWGIWGQSQAPPSSLSLHPQPLPNQLREGPDPGGVGEGKGSSPGAWFSFSCPEPEPLWETSEGY